MSTNLANKIERWEDADWTYTKSVKPTKRPYTSKTGRVYGPLSKNINAKRSN